MIFMFCVQIPANLMPTEEVCEMLEEIRGLALEVIGLSKKR